MVVDDGGTDTEKILILKYTNFYFRQWTELYKVYQLLVKIRREIVINVRCEEEMFNIGEVIIQIFNKMETNFVSLVLIQGNGAWRKIWSHFTAYMCIRTNRKFIFLVTSLRFQIFCAIDSSEDIFMVNVLHPHKFAFLCQYFHKIKRDLDTPSLLLKWNHEKLNWN